MNKQELEQFEKSAVEVCSQATRKIYKDFQLAGYELSGIELKKLNSNWVSQTTYSSGTETEFLPKTRFLIAYPNIREV
jgi:hypothetical protein